MSSERFLSIIWESVTERGREEFIRIQDVFVFISEMEKFLGVRNLLIKEEIRILIKMMKEKPNLRLYRIGISAFLTTLVHFPSITDWLRARVKVSVEDLAILVRNHDSRAQKSQTPPNFNSNYYSFNSNYSRPQSQELPRSRFDFDQVRPDFGRSKSDFGHVKSEFGHQRSDFDSRPYSGPSKAYTYNESEPLERPKKEPELGVKASLNSSKNIPYSEPQNLRPLRSSSPIRPHVSRNVTESGTRPPSKQELPEILAKTQGSTQSWTQRWIPRLWTKPKKVVFKEEPAEPKTPPHDKKLQAIVDTQSKLIRNQEVLIQNLESKLYGGSTTFNIYRFLKDNRFLKRLPVIRSTDFETISSVEVTTKVSLLIGASMAALAVLILGIFVTFKLMRFVLFVLQAITVYVPGDDYSDEEIHFSWILEYPWLEYQLYKMYDTFGY